MFVEGSQKKTDDKAGEVLGGGGGQGGGGRETQLMLLKRTVVNYLPVLLFLQRQVSRVMAVLRRRHQILIFTDHSHVT